MAEERLEGYEARADDSITRPFEEGELMSQVRVYIRLKSVEEVNQLKTSTLCLLSHETRTPLNGLLPPIDLPLANDDIGTAERRMWLETIQRRAEGLQRLSAEVVTLNHMKPGNFPFTFGMER